MVTFLPFRFLQRKPPKIQLRHGVPEAKVNAVRITLFEQLHEKPTPADKRKFLRAEAEKKSITPHQARAIYGLAIGEKLFTRKEILDALLYTAPERKAAEQKFYDTSGVQFFLKRGLDREAELKAGELHQELLKMDTKLMRSAGQEAYTTRVLALKDIYRSIANHYFGLGDVSRVIELGEKCREVAESFKRTENAGQFYYLAGTIFEETCKLLQTVIDRNPKAVSDRNLLLTHAGRMYKQVTRVEGASNLAEKAKAHLNSLRRR